MSLRKISLATGLLFAGWANAQLVLDDSLTPEQLVQDILVGGGVTISNVTFNGNSGSTLSDRIGSFVGTASNVGISDGVIIATGSINAALGPNTTGSNSSGGGDFELTDPDLAILSGMDINDAGVLEFDFIPTGDSLQFNFVFASEEYPEYVCSINDVFGFFLSGPGVTGPYANGAANIALIPGTTVPVSINTVNNGSVGSSAFDESLCVASDPNWNTHSEFYVANGEGGSGPSSQDPFYVQYDGLTTVLTARARVICGLTYHIKIAIGDASDAAWDSAVFLQAGSFASNTLPQLSAATVTGDGIVAEGCEGSVFVVNRPDGVDTTFTIDYVLSGTATPGVDYAQIPNPIVIPEGEDFVTYDLHPVSDGSVEGNETVVLTVFVVNTCGDSISSSTTITIADYQPLVIGSETPVLLQCDRDSVLLTAGVTGGYGQVELHWAGTTSTERWVPGREDASYELIASDQCPNEVHKVVYVESGCEIIVPNVITPNGDGDNDTFVIKGILGKNSHVQIFDRWGKKVLDDKNYRNNFMARDLSDGTYFYSILVEEETFSGYLTVIGQKK